MFWPGLTTRHPHSLSVGSSGTPLQRPQEGDWDAEDRALIGFQQAPFSELPPPIHVLQESGLPDADPSQPPGAPRAEGLPAVGTLHSAGGILAQVYSPNMPPPLAQPSSILPYALVSQPSVQLILQGTLPLAGCGTAQSLAPVPTMPATVSELAVPTTNNSEERTATPKTAAEKTKKEEVSAAACPSSAPVLLGPDFRYSI